MHRRRCVPTLDVTQEERGSRLGYFKNVVEGVKRVNSCIDKGKSPSQVALSLSLSLSLTPENLFVSGIDNDLSLTGRRIRRDTRAASGAVRGGAT